MNYYISDLHLFHRNVTMAGWNYDNRPFANVAEMGERIREKWNRKVTRADTVYIVGDVAMRASAETCIEYVSGLKGHKILVRGNHDDLRDPGYRQLFEEICDYKEVSDGFRGQNVKLVLCHYPILMWKHQHRGTILLYGHVHNSAEEVYFQRCLAEMNATDYSGRRTGKSEIKAFNVGCMMPYMDYEPRSIWELLDMDRHRREAEAGNAEAESTVPENAES